MGYENKPEVLKDVSFTIYSDDYLGIIGPNGGGKTTLLKAILGLLNPKKGSITYYDNGVKTNSLNIGYLPQINRIDKKFPISVSQVILSGLTPRDRFFKRYNAQDREKVNEVAQRLGIEELLPRAIGELSGGQLQRVLLGRAIIDNPKLIILDEPSTYVDKLFETNFYKLLGDINKEIAIVLVSHDVGTIISHVKNIACVNKECIIMQVPIFLRSGFWVPTTPAQSRYLGMDRSRTGYCLSTITFMITRTMGVRAIMFQPIKS